MKISFHGAAKTVTGSKHLVTLKMGDQYLLDCGMFQGLGSQTWKLNTEWGFEPSAITTLILSHAHIDHSGLIPKLVKDGFQGSIYCTSATRELACILLEDSAEIQAHDTRDYINRDAAPGHEPLFSMDDVKAAMKLFKEVEYNSWLKIDDSVELMFTDAGHLIGSAAAHLKIHEDDEIKTLTFSGDVGRYRNTLLQSPKEYPQADYIILESTYGDSLHEFGQSTPDLLLRHIKHTCLEKKGKLVIPAFSIGRTQELLFALNQLENEKRLPDLKYFVDSPLSIKATETVKKYPESFKESVQKIMEYDADPFAFNGLHYTKTTEESISLLNYSNPCVIIAASGMAEAGRIRFHLRNNIENTANTILIVGYCDPESLGGQLTNGAEGVQIMGDGYDVLAEIAVIKSLSAHGDADDLVKFLSCQDGAKVKQLFLVHGEEKVQERFKQRLELKGFGTVVIPSLHEEIDLEKLSKAPMIAEPMIQEICK